MNANTVPSIVNSIQYGLPTSCVTASNQRTPATARPKPATPAMHASMTLSTRSCRTTRQRPAPSATRTEISCERWADRANRRFATFAQAISSTKATAPWSERKTSRISPPLTRSLNGIRFGVTFSFVAGYAWLSRWPMLASSSRACSTATPSASRPMTWRLRLSRSPVSVSGGSCARGTQMSTLFENRMSSGITPTMVTALLLAFSVWPSTPGSLS